MPKNENSQLSMRSYAGYCDVCRPLNLGRNSPCFLKTEQTTYVDCLFQFFVVFPCFKVQNTIQTYTKVYLIEISIVFKLRQPSGKSAENETQHFFSFCKNIERLISLTKKLSLETLISEILLNISVYFASFKQKVVCCYTTYGSAVVNVQGTVICLRQTQTDY